MCLMCNKKCVIIVFVCHPKYAQMSLNNVLNNGGLTKSCYRKLLLKSVVRSCGKKTGLNI